jgi:hypothetical protein
LPDARTEKDCFWNAAIRLKRHPNMTFFPSANHATFPLAPSNENDYMFALLSGGT